MPVPMNSVPSRRRQPTEQMRARPPQVRRTRNGVTVVPQLGDDYSTYLKIADAMLYDAKRFGRNCVVWADEKMKKQRER